MTDKSGTSTQIITLPKGGGALQGIGEKFSPDLFTGTGNFTVPIALPPGRNGFQPQLNLVYSTGNGNGAFGLGWGLGIPGVSRQTTKGIPRYQDYHSELKERDTFILSGAEDLVSVNETLVQAQYRPRTEGLFARILHHHDTDQKDNYWEVRSKDGLVSFYGTKGQAGNDAAVIADPEKDKQGHIFAWKLVATEDPFQNRIEYEYQRDSGGEGRHNWDQLYLKEIRYVDYSDSNQQTQFLVRVHFEYQDYPNTAVPSQIDPRDIRPDPFSDCRAGFEIRTRLRCKRVHVCTYPDGKKTPVRTYEFVYLDERQDMADLEQRLPHNRVSLLSQIVVIGYDDNGKAYHFRDPDPKVQQESLPPLEFGYTSFEPEDRKFQAVGGAGLPATSLANQNLELVDLHGNGLPDILETNGTVRYWRNLGNLRYDLPRTMRYAPPHALSDPGVQMLDANGDGRTDLMLTSNPLAGYYPLTYNASWDQRSFQKYKQAPSFNLEDPEVKLVDLDGDGITDAIRSGTSLECIYNDPQDGWSKIVQVHRTSSLDVFPNVNFSDPRVKWGDMTGDNLQNIVLVYDGNVEYYPYYGYGRWGPRIHMHNSPRFRDYGYTFGYDPRRILFGDVDGDGCDDIVYVGNHKVTLWINQSGNSWSDPIEICGTPAVTDLDSLRLVDLLGTGISGVLWSTDANTSNRSHLYFLDFTGGVKPYVMNEMDNHMGAITKVQYAPSTRFYLEDSKRPATRWNTPLPFPVQVVERIEAIDVLSHGKLTTRYRYHHGYWDGAEREFRGFGMVEQLDTETFDEYDQFGLHDDISFDSIPDRHFSPPTLTKTWFHQGPVGEEFGEWEELDRTTEYWQRDAEVLEHTAQVNEYLKSLQAGSMEFTRRMRRDGLRAVRGSILRSELYALDRFINQDAVTAEDRPYTVTEYSYGLREEFPPPAGRENRLRIFFPHLIAQRTTQWERGEDPLTQFSFTGDYDSYGQPQLITIIACPRGWRSLADAPVEGYLATRKRTDYAQRDEAGHFMVDRVKRTTSFEYIQQNTSNKTVAELWDVPDGDAILSCFAQTVNYFDGLDQSQDYGTMDDYGAVTTTETLALTEEILNEAYGNQRPPYLTQGAIAWTAEYPAGFRQRITGLPGVAGYVVQDGIAAPQYQPGFFIRTGRHYDFQDDPGSGRGLVMAEYDPLENVTTIRYVYQILPTRVEDAAGLVTTAVYNYRVLLPNLVTDPNGNRTAMRFTPIGLPAGIILMGKVNQPEGDRRKEPNLPNMPALDYPSTRFEYYFHAFDNSPENDRLPIFIRTLKRQDHFWDLVRAENERRRQNGQADLTEVEIDTLFPIDELEVYNERFIEVREYSDGFGRLLQTRTQGEEERFGEALFGDGVVPADPAANGAAALIQGSVNRNIAAPNVVVSGWQIYDNKGREVEKFEPFFDVGWDYTPPSQAYQNNAQRAQLFYDPLGRAIRTLNPDGSEQVVIYGTPIDQSGFDPTQIIPTPWERYTYDPNDNAGRTHNADPHGLLCQHHWNTPASAVVDALGRTILALERNRRLENGAWSAIETYRTASTYDIRGNLIAVTDSLGRTALIQHYDLMNRAFVNASLDGGTRFTVLDAAGNPIEQRDSKGALELSAYDASNRITRLWAQDNPGQAVTLRQRLVYGDESTPGLTRAQATALNLPGRLYRHYDEAGLLQFNRYDFKGNLLEKSRRTIRDNSISNGWVASWDAPGSQNALEPAGQAYQTARRYDALNRPTQLVYPAGMAVLRPIYNRAGALERVDLDGETFVERIAYNAKGQRTLVVYGNGLMTRSAYDPQTFRLARLRTERFTSPAMLQYRPEPTQTPTQRQNNLLQDMAYTYDLAGNPTAISDRTPNAGLPVTPDRLDQAFIYDPLYRLIQATGRECDTQPNFPWEDAPRCTDITRTRPYIETYAYDPAGNMLTLAHSGLWTRHFGMAGFRPEVWRDKVDDFLAGGAPDWGTDGNRLTNVGTESQGQTHFFDANGNLTSEGASRRFTWNHANKLIVFTNQAGAGGSPSVDERYLYDAAGIRVKKWGRTNGTGAGDSTVYIDGIFEQHRWREVGRPGAKMNSLLHVMDNQSRVAVKRVGDIHGKDAGPDIQYHLGDHLGSSSWVIGGVDAQGSVFINREEYYPYGETSFGSFDRKRYRFTGKERDEKSSLYYHGARYYAPWLTRWVSSDPAGIVDGLNLYQYAFTNPLRIIDLTGLQNENVQSDASKVTSNIGTNDVHQASNTASQSRSVNKASKTENQRSVLDIRPGMPAKKYPDTLSVSPDLIPALRELQQNQTVPNDPAKVMERSGIVTKSGILHSLTKEEHIEILGEGDWSRGVNLADESSPSSKKTLEKIIQREKDPTVMLAEIGVHTHPSGMPPSPEDIGSTASATGVFNPTKRMVVNPDEIYLMIPTKETWDLKSALKQEGGNIRDLASQKFSESGRIVNSGEEFIQSLKESSLAAMSATKMVIYKYSNATQQFERVPLR